MDYLKVEGHSHLLRDKNTNSIINNNMSEYQEYLARKTTKNEENQKIQKLESEVGNMQNDLSEIKSLLRELLNGPK
jgi:polyhydroxyalkanoate synthesis regulator phasin